MLVFSIGFCAIIFIIIVIQEYYFFKYQSIKLIKLQQQYKSHIQQFTQLIKEVEKKNNELLMHDISSKQTHAKNIAEHKPTFVKINRADEYLKESSIAYLKENQLEQFYPIISESHEEDCFNDVITIRKTKPVLPELHTEKKNKTQDSPKKKGQQCLSWPIERSLFWLSSYYGLRKRKMHHGIDLASIRGTQVYPAAHGTIEQCGYQAGYGNTIVISHNKTLQTRYAHLDQIYVKKGQKVTADNPIGAVGDTGHTIKSGTDASHLHFEVCQNGRRINPLQLLPVI